MPAHKKRFCVHGHDTDVCGRRKSTGQCCECYKLYFREYRKNMKIRKLGAIYQRNHRHRQKINHAEQAVNEANRIIKERDAKINRIAEIRSGLMKLMK